MSPYPYLPIYPSTLYYLPFTNYPSLLTQLPLFNGPHTILNIRAQANETFILVWRDYSFEKKKEWNSPNMWNSTLITCGFYYLDVLIMVPNNGHYNTTWASCNGFSSDRSEIRDSKRAVKNAELTRLSSDLSELKWNFAKNAGEICFSSWVFDCDCKFTIKAQPLSLNPTPIRPPSLSELNLPRFYC